ncbi:MAG: peptide-methionine (S)-S-oxide reductase MsrA [Eubacteriales bacterium]|nr:peptide-methionine (S)-S-oxide reductase MsrA [Eubacteriales bacterium]
MRQLSALLILALMFSLAATPALSMGDGMKTIYFAGGCFWGVEHMMELVPGVKDAVSGYANGTLDNPDYGQVVSGTTGHRETVKVTYDPGLVTLEELTELFFSAIDPTVKDRQGNDVGSQYQTGIYYDDEADGGIIRTLADAEKKRHSAFVVEIEPLENFWEAEEYHQDYLIKNPGGYCHLTRQDFDRAMVTGRVESPKVAVYRRITPQDAKAAIDTGENPVIVDVREPFEFMQGHIPGAINLPLGELSASAADVLPDKGALIYLYCRSGNRSASGAYELIQMGYHNLYDLGGIIDWPYEVVK